MIHVFEGDKARRPPFRTRLQAKVAPIAGTLDDFGIDHLNVLVCLNTERATFGNILSRYHSTTGIPQCKNGNRQAAYVFASKGDIEARNVCGAEIEDRPGGHRPHGPGVS
jgi:hypothetical protein